VGQHPARPRRARQAGRLLRARPRPGARDHPRRGRRLRRQDRFVPRGAAAGLAGPPGGATGALDRDAQREHGGAGPWPRPAPDPRDRGPARRHRGGIPAHRAAGRRGLRRAGLHPPVPHPHDGPGRLRHPEGGVQRHLGHHQHHARGRLSRRGSPRGHRRHRAGHGPLRRRDRDGPGRGPPPEPHRRRRLPLHQRHRRHLRRGRLRAIARPGARGGRLRRPPRGAGPAPPGR
jgi:hypothetical protein